MATDLTSPADVHRFWFGALDAHGVADPAHRRRWFLQDDAFDQEIRERFEATLLAARDDLLKDWLEDRSGWLPYLILCDQFPRNLYRGSGEAFAWDERARAAARHGLEQGWHRHLGIDEQAFAYLPFEHSESLLDQYLSCGLLLALRDHSPRELREHTGTYLRHGQQHRDTILRFGRFPYRNAALGRPSTDAELEYLSSAEHP